MKIAITGGTGYIASALIQALSSEHDITVITRNDVDLSDYESTTRYFTNRRFDVLVHTAITGGSRLKEDTNFELDSNLRMYYNLLSNKESFVKFISIGSGAEIYFPDTPYGLSKRVIHHSMLDKENFYNIRVFAVFDENELDTRFIKANIYRYIKKEPLVIHQNKKMDFFYMKDFIKVINFYINNNNLLKEFDCTYKNSYSLSEIATIINELDSHKVNVNILSDDRGVDYTGNYVNINITYDGLHHGIQSVYQTLSCKI